MAQLALQGDISSDIKSKMRLEEFEQFLYRNGPFAYKCWTDLLGNTSVNVSSRLAKINFSEEIET